MWVKVCFCAWQGAGVSGLPNSTFSGAAFTGIGATRTRRPCLYLMVFQNLSCGQLTT